MSQAASVAAVVVSFNRRAMLERLLTSLLASQRPLQAVYVVDNASSDGTAEWLRAAYDQHPVVRLLLQGTNTGGSGGFHAGVRSAYADGHDWFWLMDDDVTVEPDGLGGLLAHADQSGCLHGRRLEADGAPVFWQQRFDEWLGMPVPTRGDPFARGPAFATNCAVFEGVLVARSTVAVIGPPDPRFFITTDDAVYALLASSVTPVRYVDHVTLRRQRALASVPLPGRSFVDASPLYRTYLMRNRGYVAHVLRSRGTYRPVGFALGTALTLGKELTRLVAVQHTLRGGAELLRGWREARRLARAPWRPMGPQDL